jgi:hypothetical protein
VKIPLGIFFWGNMSVEIKPGQIIEASKNDKRVFLEVKGVTKDGHLLIASLKAKKTTTIADPETVRNGGTLNGWQLSPLVEKEEK